MQAATALTRPCWVEIRTQALEDNYRWLTEIAAPDAELLAIVKANAYGHGLEICAPVVAKAGAKWLGVTSVEEGVAARAVCPDAEILVISGVFRGQGPDVARHNLTVVVWEPWHLDELQSVEDQCSRVPVHLEIDTGMSRQGVKPADLGPLLEWFGDGSRLRLDGVMTHLFAADEGDGEITREQLGRLEAALEQVKAAGLKPTWLNVGNSAALLSGQAATIGSMANAYGMKAMLRPGLALYGLAPEFEPGFEGGEPASLVAARERLQPVLTWKTKVVGVRTVQAGTEVGYNGTFVATEPMRLALLAVGYADGLDRKLGNRLSVLVREQRAPLVGRISMDQAVIDVTDIEGVESGDEVVLLGSQGEETITAFDHARAGGTIPWEVFTRIGARVARQRAGTKNRD
jgi:alanine racemase